MLGPTPEKISRVHYRRAGRARNSFLAQKKSQHRGFVSCSARCHRRVVNKLRIREHGLVYRSETDAARQSSAFPSICVLPSGRWLCSFAAAPLKSHAARETLLACSDDEGRSWSAPAASFQPENVEGRRGSFRSAYLTALVVNACSRPSSGLIRPIPACRFSTKPRKDCSTRASFWPSRKTKERRGRDQS